MKMKWKLVSYLVVLACLLLQAAPVMAAGTTDVTGTLPLVASDVAASSITTSSATISWKTNGNATSQVFYDTARHDSISDYASHTAVDTSLVLAHSLGLSGLASSTTYHFRARSVFTADGSDIIAISDDYTFTTPAVPSGGGGAPSPPPPPGTTDLYAAISTGGVFNKDVVARSFDKQCYLTIDKGTRGLTKSGSPLSQITMVEMELPPAPPAEANVIGLFYDFGPNGATFDPPITLIWNYDPDALPEGVAEEDLVIAYYDEGTGQWVELECVVDTQTNTISAKVSHFTAFAILGYKVVAPVPPAAFTVSGLSVLPGQVYAGDKVSIGVIVANIGGEAGSYSVTLKINDVVKATQEITVSAGRSKEVTFSTARDIPGIYAVTVDGLSGSFTVVQPPPPPPAPPAAFSLSSLSIKPAEVQPNEPITITVSVANTGGMEGSYTVVLKINDIKKDEKSVTVTVGSSQTVSFSVAKEKAGSYSVVVDGLAGSFTVLAPPEVPIVKLPVNWPLVVGVIGAVVVIGLLIYFLCWRTRLARS